MHGTRSGSALYGAGLEHAAGPREGVPAGFDAYADHAAFAYEHGFRDCGLLNAAAELPAGDEGRAVVRAHFLLEGDGGRVQRARAMAMALPDRP
jgi:hypothetical protein